MLDYDVQVFDEQGFVCHWPRDLQIPPVGHRIKCRKHGRRMAPDWEAEVVELKISAVEYNLTKNEINIVTERRKYE